MSDPQTSIRPSAIRLHRQSRVLELCYPDGRRFELPCEFLRVHSPSAEVQGHGAGQEVLQVGKKGVNITRIDPVGSYAIRLHFDDGHDTGLYSWDLLHDLGNRQEILWQQYLERLSQAGQQR